MPHPIEMRLFARPVGLLKVAICVWAGLSGSCIGQCASFTAEGFVTSNAPKAAAGDPLYFSVRSDGDKRWLMHFSGLAPSDYIEVFYDDGKTWYLNCFSTELAKRVARGEKVGKNIATAIIRRDAVPCFPRIEEAGVVWLTFLSGTFFRGSKSDYMTPPYCTGFLGRGRIVFEAYTTQRYKCSRREITELRIPEQVDFFFAARVEGRSVARIEESYGRLTNATFRLIETTNVDGRSMPLSAQLVISAPEEIAVYRRPITFAVTTTNISFPASALGYVSDVPGVTAMSDIRFGSAERKVALSYSSDHWLTDGEVQRRPEYRRAAAMAGPRRPGATTVIVLVLIAVAGLLPILVARKRYKIV